MRVLISKKDRLKLFDLLKSKYSCNSMKALARHMNLPLKTLQNWVYYERYYIPEKIILLIDSSSLRILDKKESNWGNVKGGKKTYQIIKEKYGIEEIKRRQYQGGKNARKIFRKLIPPIQISLEDPIFLEFYGILLGDGWLSRLHYKNKITHLIGISGHRILDKDFHFYCKENIKTIFQRSPYLKEIPKSNGRELLFSHVALHTFLSKELDFPIGNKINLRIHEKIYSQGFDKLKHVIRGIFDTDGSFYFDKTPAGHPYPCISIK